MGTEAGDLTPGQLDAAARLLRHRPAAPSVQFLSAGWPTWPRATWASTRTRASRCCDMTLSALPGDARAGDHRHARRAAHRHPAGAALGVDARTAPATRSPRRSVSVRWPIPSFLLGSMLLAYVSGCSTTTPIARASRVSRGPVAQPPADAVPGAGAGLRTRGARSCAPPAPRCSRSRRQDFVRTAHGKGVSPFAHPHPARAAGGAHPDRDDDRHPVRLPAGRRRRGGADLLACPGWAGRCCWAPAEGVRGGPEHGARHRAPVRAGQPRHRPALPRGGSTGARPHDRDGRRA